MCWSDVQLRQTTNGEEFLEYSERQTKTRTGENPRDVRQIKPKMFSVPGSEKDPVAASVQIIRKKEANRNERQRRFILSRYKQLYKKRNVPILGSKSRRWRE